MYTSSIYFTLKNLKNRQIFKIFIKTQNYTDFLNFFNLQIFSPQISHQKINFFLSSRKPHVKSQKVKLYITVTTLVCLSPRQCIYLWYVWCMSRFVFARGIFFISQEKFCGLNFFNKLKFFFHTKRQIFCCLLSQLSHFVLWKRRREKLNEI